MIGLYILGALVAFEAPGRHYFTVALKVFLCLAVKNTGVQCGFMLFLAFVSKIPSPFVFAGGLGEIEGTLEQFHPGAVGGHARPSYAAALVVDGQHTNP
ncbi:hypothetical protein [Nocardiopsis sp. CNS-639]|uniref:hypothetical protein n=1 Tax=Nocardiopsis sp. CNS-639 TaxID=1169153 RepID=UPI0012DBFB21|nr:hypothetical protein [Nocardiopsis sp. CNS-639]